MKCIKCGIDLGEGDLFCHKCGTPVQKINENNNEIKNENNNEIKNENMYTYERPVEQTNYNQQQVNSQNYGQPNNYGNPNQQNYGQQYKNRSNENVIRICIIVVISIAVLAAVGFFVHSLVSAINNKGNKNSSSITNSNSENTSTKGDNSGSLTTLSNTQKSSSYKVNYGGFKFYIPDNLLYEADTYNEELIIADAEQTWAIELKVEQLPYNQAKQRKSSLKAAFEQQYAEYDGKVSDATIETIGGVEYILLEVELQETNFLIGCAQLNSTYVTTFVLANEDDDYNRDNLKDLSTIISNAEYVGETKNLEMDQKVNLKGLNEAWKKAAE